MEALQRAADADFRARVATALLAGQGAVGAPDAAALERFIDTGITAARRFKLTSEADVFHFLRIIRAWLPGRAVDDLSRAAMNHLLSHGVPGAARLVRLERCLEAESGDAS